MQGLPLLAAGLLALFLAVAIALTKYGEAAARRRAVRRSLAALRGTRPAALRAGSPDPQLEASFAQRILTPTVTRLARLVRRFTPADQTQRVRRRLDLAGNPAGWDVDRILAVKLTSLLVGTVAAAGASVALGAGPLSVVGVGIVVGFLGYVAPTLVLFQVAYQRTERIRRELPDALDLLTISVEAGLPFDAALVRVARHTSGPLAAELARVLQEMQIGLGRADAMRALGERTDSAELRGFVTAMVQAESFGIPIAAVLRVQAREMRVKRSQRAEELAQKVPVKILFPLVFCILPCLFIVVLGPAALTVLHALTRR